MYYHTRRAALLYEYGPPSKVVIAVEDTEKWYSLWVVYPSGAVEVLDFDNLPSPAGQPQYCDHVPNPMAVCEYAAINNYDICSVSLAAITRRWYNGFLDTAHYVEHSDNSNEY